MTSLTTSMSRDLPQSSPSPSRGGPSSPSPTRNTRSASLCTNAHIPIGSSSSHQKPWSPKPGGYVGNFVAPSHVAAQSNYPSLFYSMYVYNPLLAKGNEERAMDNILYYYPPEDDDNTKMNRVGFSTACACITERFSIIRDDARDREDMDGYDPSTAATETPLCCDGMGIDGQRDLADEIRTRHRLITLYSPVQDIWFAVETHPHVDSRNVKQLLRRAVSAFITLCGPRAFLLESPPAKKYVPGADPDYDQRLRYSEYNRSAIHNYFSDFANFLANFGLPSPVAGVTVHDGGRGASVSARDSSVGGEGGADTTTPVTSSPTQQQDPYLTYRQQTASDALFAFPPRVADSVDALATTALEALVGRYLRVVESSCGELWSERCGEYELTMNSEKRPNMGKEPSLFCKQSAYKVATLDTMYQNLSDVGLFNWFVPQLTRGAEGVLAQQQRMMPPAESPRSADSSSRTSSLPTSPLQPTPHSTESSPFQAMLSSSTALHPTIGARVVSPYGYEDLIKIERVTSNTYPTSPTSPHTDPRKAVSSLSTLLCHVDEGRVLYSSLPANLTSRLMMLVRTQLPLLDELSVEKAVDAVDTQVSQVASRLSSQVRDHTNSTTSSGDGDEASMDNMRVGADAVSRCSAKAFDLNNLTLDSLREASNYTGSLAGRSSSSSVSTSDEIRLNRRLRSLSTKCGVFDVFVERENADGTAAGEHNVYVRRAAFVRVNGFGVFILSPPMPINIPSGATHVDLRGVLGNHWYYTTMLSTALLFRRSLLREMVSCCGGVAAHGLLRACELRSSTLRTKVTRGSGVALNSDSKLRARGTTVTSGAQGPTTGRAHATTMVGSKPPVLQPSTSSTTHVAAPRNVLSGMYSSREDLSGGRSTTVASVSPHQGGGGAALPNLLRCQLLEQLSAATQLEMYHQPSMGTIIEVLGPSASSVLESLSLEVATKYLVVQSEYVAWVAVTGPEDSSRQFADPRLPLDVSLRTLKLLLRCIDPHDPWVAHNTQRHPSVLIHHAKSMYASASIRGTTAIALPPLPQNLDSSHPHSPQYAVYPTSLCSFGALSKGHAQPDADIPQVPSYAGVLAPISATHPTVMSFSGIVASRTPLWALPRDIQWEVAKYVAEALKPTRTHTTANRPNIFSSHMLGKMGSFNLGAGEIAQLLKGSEPSFSSPHTSSPSSEEHARQAAAYNSVIASLKALEAQTGLTGTSVAPRGEYSSSDLAVEPSSTVSELWVSLCPVRRGGIRIHRHDLGRGGGGTHLGDASTQDDGHASASLGAARGDLLGLANSGSGQVLAIFFPNVRPGTPAIYANLLQCMELGSLLFSRALGTTDS